MYNGKGHVKQMIRGFQSQGKEVPASACKFFFFLPDRFHAHFSTLVIYEMVAATLAIGTYYSQKSSLKRYVAKVDFKLGDVNSIHIYSRIL